MSRKPRATVPAEDRFAKYVGQPDTGGCIPWLGAKASTGYGVLKCAGKPIGAHRLAFTLFRGEIPKGLHVLHSCDNRGCVNPEHLSTGTPLDNMRDMISKGRDRHEGFIGEAHPMAKLREGDVREILRLLSTGLTQREVASRFNVATGTVKHIRAGESWAHVTAEAVQ